ncbi:MAG: sulfatase [Planctomycetaceae bacterium]|nr:sulfatase [Planctomycetaceae bacterium]
MRPLPVNRPLEQRLARRQFLTRSAGGLGALALSQLMGPSNAAELKNHFPARAKRVIYLFMSGGPSQMETFDPKPKLRELHGQPLPESIRQGQRLTSMTSGYDPKIAQSEHEFNRMGQCGHEMNVLFKHLSGVADDISIVRSLHTEPINHDPAVTFLQTGSGVEGRPCMGSWLSYGLGTENSDLPAFVVLVSSGGQPLLSRYWHNGFLPSRHQGVQFQTQGDPVLFLSDPKGIDRNNRGQMIERMNQLNRMRYQEIGDPEIEARIDAFEMAFRMQASVPELMDLSSETKQTLEMYGAQPGQSSFANNCLLARRLAERGVRFIQLYERGWDHHGAVNSSMRNKIPQVDRPCAALIKDLKQRGLLEDTLVIWGGEFGRTSYSQHNRGKEYGRDHHPRCFNIWMAGGGIRPGVNYGRTDELGYNVIENEVHVHDLQATILHCLGIDHEQLTYRFKGRDFRLTDVHGKVVQDLIL